MLILDSPQPTIGANVTVALEDSTSADRGIGALKRWYRRQMFQPGPLGVFVNPFYITRKSLNWHIEQLAPQIGGRTLDVGCGRRPYRNLFSTQEYVGLEIDTPENRRTKQADVFYDGNRFPFDDGSFDSVVFFEVFEHVFNPDAFLDEVCRVLAPGGTVLATVPMVWDEHEQPFDYARYTSFGLTHCFQQHGLEVLEHRRSVDDIRVIFQLLNEYIYKKTATANPYVNVLTTTLLMAPVTLAGCLAGLVLPRNTDLFLDNVILARKTA